MKKIIDFLNNIEEKILVLMLAVSVVVIFIQVIMRYVFNSSLSWSEELARYLYIWQGWLGISLVERYRMHISIDVLASKFSGTVAKILYTAVCLVCIFSSLFMAYYGYLMVGFNISNGSRTPALRIPWALVYAALPIGCTLYVIRVFFHMLDGWKTNPNDKAIQESGEHVK